MPYVPDSLDMYNRHEAKQEAWLKSRPVCSECGEPIQDEFCFEINGECICERCLMDNHRKYTEDLCES